MYKFSAFLAKNPSVLRRGFLVLFGVIVLLVGVKSYLLGVPGHFNYWGRLVVREVSVGVGLLSLVVACLPRTTRNEKARKQAARKEHQAARKLRRKRPK